MDRRTLGLLVVFVGFILLLQNIGPDVGIRDVSFARLWPAVLIVYGVATMARGGKHGGPELLVGGLIAVVGAVFLVETMFGIDLWSQVGNIVGNVWPMALIVFGMYLVLRGRE